MLSLWHRLPKRLRYRVAVAWYELVSRLDRRGEVLFLNHGYEMLAADEPRPELSAADEPDRFPIQLYHHVASAIDWTGVVGIEVGCGRGGGASYIMRYLKPRSLVGLDIAGNAIAFCRERHAFAGLSFECGDAQRLPFPDESFDVVLNVESSGSYPDREAFFREAVRVLRPGGYFLFADYRSRPRIPKLRRQLSALALQTVREADISANVQAALLLDDARKRRLIQEIVPRGLRRLAGRFAFLRGGADDELSAFERGERVYLSFAFVKPAP